MTKEIKAEQAHYLEKEIVRIKTNMGEAYFLLGELFKKIRDEKLYRLLDYNTMTEFIAQPELAFSRSSVYDYIHMYEIYVEELGFNTDILSAVQYSQLRKILPVVLSDPEEWIEKARTLSRGDLTLEVGEVRNPREMAEWEKSPDLRTPLKLNASKSAEKIYANLIKQIDTCPICGKREDLTMHHFPHTRVRAGKEKGWQQIPICLQCHGEATDKPNEWLIVSQYKLFDFFYYIVLEVLKIKLEG